MQVLYIAYVTLYRSSIERQIRFAASCIILMASQLLIDKMAVQMGTGCVGYWVHKLTWQWVGLRRVSYFVGWVGPHGR